MEALKQLHIFFLAHKEAVTMYANIAIPVALIISIVALMFSRRAVSLQTKSLQADLFSEVVGRIHGIQDQQKDYENEDKVLDWYIRLFDAFEYFAFCANHKYLTEDMSKYYASSIDRYFSEAQKHEDVVEYIKGLPLQQLSELRNYYRGIKGKTSPF